MSGSYQWNKCLNRSVRKRIISGDCTAPFAKTNCFNGALSYRRLLMSRCSLAWKLRSVRRCEQYMDPLRLHVTQRGNSFVAEGRHPVLTAVGHRPRTPPKMRALWRSRFLERARGRPR
jgi:hypothetical protein